MPRFPSIARAGALLLICCGVFAFSVGRSHADAVAPACSMNQLRLAHGGFAEGGTQQLAAQFVLRNISSHTCSTRGYPQVALLDSHGKKLSFTDRKGGKELMLNESPKTVTLAPGMRADVLILENTCTFRPTAIVSRIRLSLPGQSKTETTGFRTSNFEHCRTNDPSGQVLHISAIDRAD
jgi:hypothetical protein